MRLPEWIGGRRIGPEHDPLRTDLPDHANGILFRKRPDSSARHMHLVAETSGCVEHEVRKSIGEFNPFFPVRACKMGEDNGQPRKRLEEIGKERGTTMILVRMSTRA